MLYYLMRKLLFKLGGVMLAILLALPAVAQSKLRFSVVGFELDVTDFSAQSPEYKKVDGSGSLYAIIKVTSNNPDDDLREYNFNFGSLKHIVDDQHDGELWLYVQRNAKTVTITRKGYAPIQRYDLRTTIQPGKNYVMQLSAAQRPTYKQMVKFAVKPAKTKAVVLVKSAKEGAVEELFGMPTPRRARWQRASSSAATPTVSSHRAVTMWREGFFSTTAAQYSTRI